MKTWMLRSLPVIGILVGLGLGYLGGVQHAARTAAKPAVTVDAPAAPKAVVTERVVERPVIVNLTDLELKIDAIAAQLGSNAGPGRPKRKSKAPLK